MPMGTRVQLKSLTREYVQTSPTYRSGDKSLARPTSRCILFDDENISFEVSLVLYIEIILIFRAWGSVVVKALRH